MILDTSAKTSSGDLEKSENIGRIQIRDKNGHPAEYSGVFSINGIRPDTGYGETDTGTYPVKKKI